MSPAGQVRADRKPDVNVGPITAYGGNGHEWPWHQASAQHVAGRAGVGNTGKMRVLIDVTHLPRKWHGRETVPQREIDRG